MKIRYLYNDLLKYLDHKNDLVITGMRQVGKYIFPIPVF